MGATNNDDRKLLQGNQSGEKMTNEEILKLKQDGVISIDKEKIIYSPSPVGTDNTNADLLPCNSF